MAVERFRAPRLPNRGNRARLALPITAGAVVLLGYFAYGACKIEVPTGMQAVLVRKTGIDLPTDQEIAPPPKGGAYSKGVQPGVLTEGRYFYNPFVWDWSILPQFEVKPGQIGVRIALIGEELPVGQVLAEPGQKGVRRDVLGPGRYAYNPYAEVIETYEPVTISPGFRGVKTLLTGKEPKDPNVVLVGRGERGVQRDTLPPGTYPLNPYEVRVSIVDCRSSRYATGGKDDEMSFLTSDGFEVRFDLAIEYRVIEERAPEVFVLYNEDQNGDGIDEEVIRKIITPEVRSICRINGSKISGSEFIGGDSRTVFREQLLKSLTANCREQGVEILPDGVSITANYPPERIVEPMNKREVSKQNLALYQQQKSQQEVEKTLKVETVLVKRKEAIVEADREVIEKVTKAEAEQSVAITLAGQKLAVAKSQLQAAKDKASAVVAQGEAEAEGIRFDNKAQLAGLKTQVEAFGGDGSALAQNLLILKLAPAYRSILTNSDGALMDVFRQMTATPTAKTDRNGSLAPALPPIFAPTTAETASAEDHR